MELLFKNEKSHLLRNVIDKIIYHQRGNNGLSRLQLLLHKQYNTEEHTLAVTFI